MDREKYDVIVVGGGPAGMMAAGTAALRGLKVLILEKNKRLGEKLRITGGGRCNVTNAEFDDRVLLKNYGEAEPFLYSAFSQFGPKKTFKFFEERGLPLVVEANKRAFPNTFKAPDVCVVMEKYCDHKNITIRTGLPVSKILQEGSRIAGVVSRGLTYEADKFIFATGGFSHPETGSTGDSFPWLGLLGHKVKQPTPAIVPLAASDNWIKSLAGITLPEVKITFFVDGKKAFSKIGNILCTHFGLSGPLILNSAKQVGDLLHTGEVTAMINLYPKNDLGEIYKLVLDLFDNNKNKTLKNVFSELVPEGTTRAILTLLGGALSETKVHSIKKDERKMIAKLLQALPVKITGLMGYDRAVVADGGVLLSEVDMKTMRSKVCENLFVTGDLLDINRPSGGFSLQLCWTTGFVAGSNV